MICPKCKTQNVEGSKFCEGCGASLSAPIPSAARHCSSCGAEVKAGAKFCAACGASTQPGTAAPPATRPAPAPAPATAPTRAAAPAPAPRSAPAPAPRQQQHYTQPQYAQPQPRQSSGCGKGCGIGCGAIGLILAVLLVAGYWGFSTIVLSRPEAFVGTWQMVEGKNSLGGDKFKLELAEGGVKVVPPDGAAAPADIILKPAGTRKLATTLTNPADPSQKAEISVELNGLGTQMTLTAKLPGGKTEEAKAKRAGP